MNILKLRTQRMKLITWLYIYIPWPFPPVWGVANNTKRQQKQWVFYSVAETPLSPGRLAQERKRQKRIFKTTPTGTDRQDYHEEEIQNESLMLQSLTNRSKI